MGDTDKVLAKPPGGLKMSPHAWEGWRAGGAGADLLLLYLFCLSQNGSEPSRARLVRRVEK